ncbi:SlyX family protein [Noviherbaspirillum sp. CPCC 100848]|uniref:SlyX family protein n=1 Tax=Noviherbaspirillum album TaxID=3080276 RepID=A0ABU6JIX0_9BURK|nr:SlyX family protein [Noviherbaspirillum sp. CPCC 100848]MEC4723604.1 SlyX family protein [Noviherbaspirillum sp. CPCC 100848]
MTIEERLVDIEIKIARQEDLADTLNRTIYEQQKKIDELEALCTALARQLREMRDAAKDGAHAAPFNEKPPHY